MDEFTDLMPLNFRTRSSPLIAAAVVALVALVHSASASSASPVIPPVNLPVYEVVGTPLASVVEPDAFGSAATVITARQLQEMEPLDFASALRRAPGVTITRFNQVGAFGGSEGGAFFVRGLGTSRPGGEIKTFVDGAPKLNGVFNHPLLDLLSVDAAERIEVHGRATPLQFGNTFAAVSVTTPRMAGAGEIARGSVAAGSFGTLVEHLDLGVRRGGVEAYASQSLRRSDGHRADSGGRLENYLLRLGWSIAPQWEASIMVNRTQNRGTDPGIEGAASGPPSTRGERYLTSDWHTVAAIAHKSGAASGSLRAYLNDGDADWIRRQYSGNADSLGSWRLYGLRWREQLTPWPGGNVVLGADLDYDRGTITTVPPGTAPALTFGPTTMRVFSPFLGASHAMKFGQFVTITPSVGVRHYSHSAFNTKWAPQAGVTIVTGKTHWHLGGSRAVNYPGLEVAVFSELFIPALGASWKALRPEEADQFEAGVRHAVNNRSAFAITLFRNRAHNRYVIAFPPPPPPRYANLESYRTEGAELTGDIAWNENLALFAAASLLRTSSGDIPYSPKSSFTAGLNWRLARRWRLSADAIYISSMHAASEARTAATPNPIVVGAQFMLNARLSRRFEWGERGVHRGEIFLSGENLTDRDFAYQPGYPIPGANFLIGVRLER